MTLTAFFLIVSSATLHAGWNLIAKKNTMTVVLYWILAVQPSGRQDTPQAQAAMRGFRDGMDNSKTVISVSYYSIRAIVLSLILFVIVIGFKSRRAILRDFIRQRNAPVKWVGVSVILIGVVFSVM